MYHSSKQFKLDKLYYLTSYLFVCVLLNLSSSVVHAASQGKAGTQSTASVEISVTVNQSLTTVSPNEILLSNSIQKYLSTSKPFCIANNGFEKNASVPYELIVDRLEPFNANLDRLPFNIFLEDKNNKQLLTSGTKIAKQSNLKTNENLLEDCAKTGTQLSIENNNSKNTLQPNSAGLMLLLVSPN